MQQHFKNARLIFGDNSNTYDKLCDIIVKDDKIVYLGDSVEESKDEIVYNLNGKILLPSFANSNSNSYLSPFIFYQDKEVDSSLIYEYQSYINNFTDEEKEILINYHLAKNIQSGVTFVDDSAIFSEKIANLLNKYNLNGRVNFYNKENNFQNIKQIYRCDLSMSDNLLCSISQDSAENKIPVSIKICETLEEAGEIDKKYNKSCVRYVEDLGLLDRNVTLFGCNFLDKDDLEILCTYDCDVVVSNFANLYLARGMPNVVNLISNGITVSFGSEFNTEVDMFSEMKNCYLLTRNLLCDFDAISPYEIFEMATINSKLSMGFSNNLQVGDYANFVIYNSENKIVNYDDFYKEFILKFDKSDICMTISNGKIVYENGKFNDIDFEKLSGNYNQLLRRKIWKYLKF